jgi:hypothetical protein
MTYSVVHSPFRREPREMPPQELERFYQWFFRVMPERAAQLADYVKATPGFKSWESNYLPTSLDSLGEWFANHVEIGAHGRAVATIADVNRWELSSETFSLCMDIGMYLGETLQKNNPSLRWEQIISDRRFADYGYPVLVGFSNAPLNPIRIVTTIAQGIAISRYTGARLREVYNIWNELAKPTS